MLHMGPDASSKGSLQRSLSAWVALSQKVIDTGVLDIKSALSQALFITYIPLQTSSRVP